MIEQLAEKFNGQLPAEVHVLGFLLTNCAMQDLLFDFEMAHDRITSAASKIFSTFRTPYIKRVTTSSASNLQMFEHLFLLCFCEYILNFIFVRVVVSLLSKVRLLIPSRYYTLCLQIISTSFETWKRSEAVVQRHKFISPNSARALFLV